MNDAQWLVDLEEAGATLVSQGGRLVLRSAPPLAAELTAPFDAPDGAERLKAAWCSREWRAHQDEKPLPLHDPRPDLTADSKSWTSLLHLAWYEDHDLWGALHGLRCVGGRLMRSEGRTVIAPGPVTLPVGTSDADYPTGRTRADYPQGMTREEYSVFRETYLMPRAATLQMLLRVGGGGSK